MVFSSRSRGRSRSSSSSSRSSGENPTAETVDGKGSIHILSQVQLVWSGMIRIGLWLWL